MNNDKMQDLATRLKQRYGIAYTVGYNTTVHYGLDKHPLIAEAIAALSTHGQESEAQVVGFRITSKNGAVSLTLREPDAYELRECKIEPVVLADSVAVQEPVAKVIFTNRSKPDVEWLVDKVTKGTLLYASPTLDKE